MQPSPAEAARLAPLRKKLSDRAVKILHTTISLKDTYAGIGSVAFSCYRQGLSFEDFAGLVWFSDLGAQYRDENGLKTRGQFDKNIRGAWEFADEKFDHGHDQRVIRNRLALLSDRIKAASWPGKTGSSDRAVALALVEIGYGLNKFTFYAPIREIADLAMVGVETARRAVLRLSKTGLVFVTWPPKKEAQADKPQANDYRMNLDWVGKSSSADETHSVNKAPTTLCVSFTEKTRHPAFAKKALGAVGCQVWEFLRERQEPLTQKEIVSGTGRSSSAVSDLLKRMVGFGLVTFHPGRPARYGFDPAGDLGAVADAYGTADYWDRLEEKRKREREGWEAVREQQAAGTYVRVTPVAAKKVRDQARLVLDSPIEDIPGWATSSQKPDADVVCRHDPFTEPCECDRNWGTVTVPDPFLDAVKEGE